MGEAESPGNVTLDFTPGYGIGSPAWEYQVDSVGVIDNISVNNEGNGYEVGRRHHNGNIRSPHGL